jgi:hypothetical protein
MNIGDVFLYQNWKWKEMIYMEKEFIFFFATNKTGKRFNSYLGV